MNKEKEIQVLKKIAFEPFIPWLVRYLPLPGIKTKLH
jgi:hypothetical protein